MLISFKENENDEKLHESQTPWLSQHLKLRKSLKIQLVQINLRITMQVPSKPNLASYENQLKKLFVPNVFILKKRYNKNYNNKMSIEEVVMNMTNGCHMNPLTIL
jgi:hypothetical protein